jgi:hypothetical protein
LIWQVICSAGRSLFHEVQKKTYFGIYEIASKNGEPAVSFLIKMRFAESISRSIDHMRYVREHRQRLVWVPIDRIAQM